MRTGTETSNIKNNLKQRIAHFDEAGRHLLEFSEDKSLSKDEKEKILTFLRKVGEEITPLRQFLEELSSVSTKCAYCGETVSYDGVKYSCGNCNREYVLQPYVPKVETEKKERRKE